MVCQHIRPSNFRASSFHFSSDVTSRFPRSLSFPPPSSSHQMAYCHPTQQHPHYSNDTSFPPLVSPYISIPALSISPTITYFRKTCVKGSLSGPKGLHTTIVLLLPTMIDCSSDRMATGNAHTMASSHIMTAVNTVSGFVWNDREREIKGRVLNGS